MKFAIVVPLIILASTFAALSGVTVGAYATNEGAGDFVVYRRVVGEGFMCYGYDPTSGVTTNTFYAGSDGRCHLKDLLWIKLYLGAKQKLPSWSLYFIPKPSTLAEEVQ